MSLIAPDTTVTLYKGVDIGDVHALCFDNVGDQRTYFHNKVYKTAVECSYERVGDPLVLDLPISDMYQFDYLSFKNSAFENKEIYARVGRPVYINNEVLAIPYEVDDYQTFMFDYKMDACPVTREHITASEAVAERTDPYALSLLGKGYMNTPEPISFSPSNRKMRGGISGASYCEFIPFVDFSPNAPVARRPRIFMVMSQDPDLDNPDNPWGTTPPPMILDGLNFTTVCRVKSFAFDSMGLDELKQTLDDYTVKGMVSSIIGIYILPELFRYVYDSGNSGVWKYDYTLSIPKATNIFNKKLLRFPYRYITASDCLGNKKEYHIERFSDGGITEESDAYGVTFGVFFTFNGAPQVTLAPKNYNGSNRLYIGSDADNPYKDYNFEEKMVFNMFPQISYNTDGYLSYLGQQLRGQALADTTAHPLAYNDTLQFMKGEARIAGQTLGAGANMAKDAGTGNLPSLGMDIAGYGIGLGGTMLQNSADNWNYGLRKKAHVSASQIISEGRSIYDKAYVPDYLLAANPVFAADDYHGGVNDSATSAYMFERFGFMLDVIEPFSDMMQKYDRFLSAYGYNVCDFKIPNIAKYNMTGSDKPSFVVYPGGKPMTYVKTEGANVSGIPLDACRYIESMFDGGHWFIDGSLLINGGS